uniref:Uncharacterized protein n=1 Tax=viral metagenome TaxID=1070528 RepID=A0A6C0E958_9ZZZZ
MSFRVQCGHNLRIVDELSKCRIALMGNSSYPGIGEFTIKSFFLRTNKEHLKANSNIRDYLTLARISNFNNYPIIYYNSVTHESFTIRWHHINVKFKGFLKTYQYYENRCNKVTINNYKFESNFDGYLALPISDILKYYYYMNRDLPDFGMNNVDPNDMKIYKQLFQMATEDISITIDTKKIFGAIHYSYSVYRVENDFPVWTNVIYLGSLILIDPKKLGNISVVKDILDLYVRGYTDANCPKKVIYYDQPVSLEQVYREHENLNNHTNRKTYNELTRTLKPKESEIIDKYDEFIIPNNTSKAPYNDYLCLYSENNIKDMNYPSFAYRKFLVSEWIPGYSSKRINFKIDSSLKYNKNQKLKHAQEKRNKPINRDDSTANYKLKDDLGNYGYKTTISSKIYAMAKRSSRYDIQESIDMVKYNTYDEDEDYYEDYYDENEEEYYDESVEEYYDEDEEEYINDDDTLGSDYDYCE